MSASGQKRKYANLVKVVRFTRDERTGKRTTYVVGFVPRPPDAPARAGQTWVCEVIITNPLGKLRFVVAQAPQQAEKACPKRYLSTL